MKIFYCRISTEEQNEARQLKLSEEAKAEKVFIDKSSGKDTNREQLKAMLQYIREGDTVITESISRIARNIRDLLFIIDEFNNKGVNFISLKENIDTDTPTGKFMLSVFGAMAELERESILDRQREGITEAKAKGKYKGRKPKQINEEQFKQLCKEWKAGQRTAISIMRYFNITATTFYRWIKEKGIQ